LLKVMENETEGGLGVGEGLGQDSVGEGLQVIDSVCDTVHSGERVGDFERLYVGV